MQFIKKRYVVFIHDMIMVGLAWFGAFWLRFNLEAIPWVYFQKMWQLMPLTLIVQLPIFYSFGLYRGIWRYASMPDLQRIVKSIFLGTGILLLAIYLGRGFSDVPRAVLPLYTLLLTAMLAVPRFLYRWGRDLNLHHQTAQKILVVGAGAAAASIIRDLQRNRDRFIPMALVDDDPIKLGHEINGVRVMGKIQELPELAKRLQIDLIIIAIPSANSATMRQIVDCCVASKCKFSTLPGLASLANGQVSVDALRDVSLEDLLGRDEVDMNWDQVIPVIKNKKVLITGGGGSIGSELCHQVANLQPSELVIIENCEYNLHKIEQALVNFNGKKYFYLESVTDRAGIAVILQRHKPDIIFHAAAYKHVPILEYQPHLAIINNVLGTKVVAEEAMAVDVGHVVLISTDKAVCPSSFMGASKRMAELLCQSFAGQSNTRFITVRFGNVLGSTGSVIPIFKQQIAAGGPVTVTHPDVERYFMTIPEACRLILTASAMGQGGEIFVLDMGESVKIRNLAEQLIHLAGKRLDTDISIEYIGLRPGEKIREILFYDSELFDKTAHPKIWMAKNELAGVLNSKLFEQLTVFARSQDSAGIRRTLMQIIPDYEPVDVLTGVKVRVARTQTAAKRDVQSTG